MAADSAASSRVGLKLWRSDPAAGGESWRDRRASGGAPSSGRKGSAAWKPDPVSGSGSGSGSLAVSAMPAGRRVIARSALRLRSIDGKASAPAFMPSRTGSPGTSGSAPPSRSPNGVAIVNAAAIGLEPGTTAVSWSSPSTGIWKTPARMIRASRGENPAGIGASTPSAEPAGRSPARCQATMPPPRARLETRTAARAGRVDATIRNAPQLPGHAAGLSLGRLMRH